MFVPRGWWHCVLNVEATVAVTQNYVSDCNLTEVLHFLRTKGEQVPSTFRTVPQTPILSIGVWLQPWRAPSPDVCRSAECAVSGQGVLPTPDAKFRPLILGQVEAALQQQERKASKRSMWAQLTESASASASLPSSSSANAIIDSKRFRFNFSANSPQQI